MRSMFPLTQLQLSNRHKDVHTVAMNDTSVKVSLLTERKYTDEQTSKELWVVMSDEKVKESLFSLYSYFKHKTKKNLFVHLLF